MKNAKKFWGLFILIPLIFSCTDPSLPNIDGMWQLKTVENTEGKHPVDTIFYSFQHQRLFSVTVLNADYTRLWSPNDPTVVFSGYTHFSADNQLTLDLNNPGVLYESNTIDHKKGDDWKFIPWATPNREKSSATLKIEKHTSKQLILRHDDTNTTYSFIRF